MEVKLLELSGDVAVIGVAGELVHETLEPFLTEVLALGGVEDRHLVLDVTEVEILGLVRLPGRWPNTPEPTAATWSSPATRGWPSG